MFFSFSHGCGNHPDMYRQNEESKATGCVNPSRRCVPVEWETHFLDRRHLWLPRFTSFIGVFRLKEAPPMHPLTACFRLFPPVFCPSIASNLSLWDAFYRHLSDTEVFKTYIPLAQWVIPSSRRIYISLNGNRLFEMDFSTFNGNTSYRDFQGW